MMAQQVTPETEAEADPGRVVRALVRRAGQAALATTLTRGGRARPYVSLVLLACDHDASPILLLSSLAEHTKNLAAEPQAALLYDGTAGREDPLTGPRASLLGALRPVADDALAGRLKARFLARHPSAQAYAQFKDFRVTRMAVERAHLVAGFGRIHWLEAPDILFDAGGCATLAVAEAAIVAHMNEGHGAALGLIAERTLGLTHRAAAQDGVWVMTGIDPEGLDLRRGARLARAEFDKPVRDAESARAALVGLTRRARAVSVVNSG